MNLYLTQAIRAYTELFQTGSIQSSVEGENLMLNLKANVTGDILICIGPKEKRRSNDPDLMELIGSDSSLHQMKEQAFKSLHQKLHGLILVPQGLVWIINFSFYISLYLLKSDQIKGLILLQNLSIQNWPFLMLILISTGTVLFGKTIGFKLLSSIFSGLFWVIRKIRWLRNKRNVKPYFNFQNSLINI
ncbi:MAG: hypothetical protein WAO52_07690 [Prolixibacteraceae bacterium]